MSQLDENKKPPCALEIETAILGAMLLENECIPRVSELLKADRFFDKKNNIVFKAILDLFNSGEPVDTVTLYNYLNNSGEIESIGGAAYISKLSQDISSSANVDYHAKIVLEKWILRKLITTSNEVASLAYSNNDVFDTVALAEQKFFEIMHSIEVSNIHTADELVKKAVELLEKIKSGHFSDLYRKTGFHDYDNSFTGFFNSDLIILAARPSIGKTSLALDVSKNVSEDEFSAFFSYEMSDIQLINKLISAECGVPVSDIISGKIPQEKGPAYARACHKISKLKLLINDKCPNIDELKNSCRKLKRERNIAFIVIDYIQLMVGKSHSMREREVSMISRELKMLAKELNVPILALSQLNRKVEERSSKRPMLADLRESGAIEQDADTVLLLHRPEFYDMESFVDGKYKTQSCVGVAELINAKGRLVGTGSTLIGFKKETANFNNLEVRHNDDFPEYYFNN